MRIFKPIQLTRPSTTAIAMATLVAAIVLWHSVWLPLLLDPNLSTASPVRLLYATALPVLLLTGVLIALTGRVGLAMCLSHALLVLLFLASARKLMHLNMPLHAADLLMVRSVAASTDLLSHYVQFTGPEVRRFLVLLVAGLLCLRFEPAQISVASRLALLLAASGVAVSMQTADNPLGRYVQAEWIRSIPWEPRQNVKANGLLATLNKDLAQLSMPVPMAPPGVDFDVMPPQTAPAGTERPDIVVVMSESFFRPDTLAGIPDCFGTPHYCKLRERALWGNLVVPTFGGGTLRTEFEFLTGISLTAFPRHSYPYLSLIHRPMASAIWDLKKLGYRTIAIHPNVRTFWNRHAVFPLLGFDEFRSRSSFGEASLAGYYISDAELSESIREELAKDTSEPRFIFAISMENHGPWGRRPNIDVQHVERITAPASLPAAIMREWQEFIYHLENADRELGQLAEYVDSRERPTVLLFFGDHLPGLPTVFNSLPPKSAERHHEIPTPYLMISNRWRDTRRVDTFSYRLAPLALSQLGLCFDTFCKEERQIPDAGAATSVSLRDLHLWRYHQPVQLP